MLSHYEGANGVKTGYTTASGRCLVSGAIRQGMQLICVVLDEGNMWGKSAELLNEAFERYRLHTLFKKGEPFMVNGKTFTVGKDIAYPLKDGEKDSLRYEYVLRAPFPAGKEQDGGRLYVKLANRLIFSEKVYTI